MCADACRILRNHLKRYPNRLLSSCEYTDRWRARAHRVQSWLSGRAGGTELDLLTALALVAAVLPLLWPYQQVNFQGLRGGIATTTDEGTVLFVAESIRRGSALYREVWDFKGPVGYLPLTLGLALADEPGLAAGRKAMLGVIALWSGATYLAARRVAASRAIGVLFALLPPFLCWPTWPYAYQDFCAQLCTTLAVTCALVAITRPPWFGLAGAWAALAFWTSLGQGLPAFACLGGALVLTHFAIDGPRAATTVARRYLTGACAVTLPLLSWLASQRALPQAMRAMFVFPFTSYISPSNETEYGEDQLWYVAHWRGDGEWPGHAAHVFTSAIVWLPRAGMLIALSIGGLLLYLAGHRLVTGRGSRLAPNRAKLLQLVIPASVAGSFVPVAIGVTRSDLCHIGFVCQTSILVLALLASRWWWGSHHLLTWFGTATRGLFVGGLGFVTLTALGFHVYLLQKPFEKVDLDGWFRVEYNGHGIAARTRPDDRIVVQHSSGYHYLAAGRETSLPYVYLSDDAYSDRQWPAAARWIVKSPPRVMFIDAGRLARLSSHQPIIQSLYFGYSGHYMLNDRRPGPPLCPDGDWSFRAERAVDEIPLRLHRHGHASANYLAILGPSSLQAHVDEDRVAWFANKDTYVAKLAPDGRSMAGRYYRRNRPDERFTAKLVSCRAESQMAVLAE